MIVHKNNSLTNGQRGSIISVVSHGLVAQLGAHHIRIVGVGSSNLLESTKNDSHPVGWLQLFINIWRFGIPDCF